MVGMKHAPLNSLHAAVVSAKPDTPFEKIDKQDFIVKALQDKLCDLAV